MPHDPWDVGPKVAPSKAPVAKAKPSRPTQPEAKAAGPRTKPSYTGPEAHSGLLYGQPGYAPAAPGAPRHKVAPAPPSQADVQFGNIVKAIGPDVVKKASNPRVAGLQSVLGDVTGIPSIVNAATSGHHLAGAAVSAASLFPVGRFGRAADLLAKLGRGGKAAEDVAKVAPTVAREARPVVAPAAKQAAEKAAPQVRHVPMTPEQATARLAKLDKQHEQLLKKIAPEVNPYAKGEKGIAGREPDATSSSAETRGRNTMRGRMDAGKKPATGKAIEGRVGGGTGRIKTIQQEVHDLAETKLHETIAKYPNEPAVQKIAAMIAEREQLRAALNAHAEAAFAGHPPPELPTHAVPVPGAAPMLPQERPGVLPHWNPQGQLFPRADSPGRFATAPREPSTLFPRETSPTLFHGSKNGLPERSAAGTPIGFPVHLGTEEAAAARAAHVGGNTVEAFQIKPGLKLAGSAEAPLTEEQLGAAPGRMLGIGAQSERDAIKKLKAQGYQGAVYRNGVEDKGSVSYLIFDHRNIVKPAETSGTPLSPQGEVFQAHQPVTPRDIARATPQYGAVPKLRPGMETPGTAGQMGRIVREQLPQQKVERGLMNKDFSVERGQRFTAFNQKLQQNPTLEGFHAAMGELKGPLQKRYLPGLSELDTNALVQHVAFRAGLMPGQKVQVLKAVERMVEGQVLQPSEIKMLEQVFGRVVTGHLSEISKLRRLKIQALDAINIPRSIMASLDVSAPFRQGLVVGATHPVIFSRNLGPMFKSLLSQATYDDYLARIHAGPNWSRMEGRVAFTEVGRDLSKREEQFSSHLAETITGGKYSFVKASGRAYTGFLDMVRSDLFDTLHAQAMRLDPARNPDDPKFLDDLARLVNDMTGRGQLPGALKNHAVTLNTLFFSPRLLQSRINLLASPIAYARADPFVRREALKTVAQTAGVLGTLLAFAGWAGAKVITDPRSADFAKLKFGNTRIDIGGGFQQVIRLAAQQATQSTVNAAGKTIPFGAEGPGKVTSWDTFFRFVRSKAAPVPGLVVDAAQRQTFGGQPFKPGQLSLNNPFISRLLPLGLQDAITTGEQSHSIPAGIGAFGASGIGLGVQSYPPKKAKGGGGAVDPWGVGGGSSPDPWGVSP